MTSYPLTFEELAALVVLVRGLAWCPTSWDLPGGRRAWRVVLSDADREKVLAAARRLAERAVEDGAWTYNPLDAEEACRN